MTRRLGPISRRGLIRELRRRGWSGPRSGGRHQMMTKGTHKLTLPNLHRGDIGADLLAVILEQAGIPREQWQREWRSLSRSTGLRSRVLRWCVLRSDGAIACWGRNANWNNTHRIGQADAPSGTFGVLTRRLHACLRWCNASARDPQLLAVQRRERKRVRAEEHCRWGRLAAQAA